jgi:hypothetical protein
LLVPVNQASAEILGEHAVEAVEHHLHVVRALGQVAVPPEVALGVEPRRAADGLAPEEHTAPKKVRKRVRRAC